MSILWWRCGTSEEPNEWLTSRRTLRATANKKSAGVCSHRGYHTGAWHGRKYCHLLGGERCTFAAAAVRRSRSTGSDLAYAAAIKFPRDNHVHGFSGKLS